MDLISKHMELEICNSAKISVAEKCELFSDMKATS